MIKTLSKARKQEHIKFRIPRSVQDCIPIRRIWADGIFQVGHQFSKTWSFTDINALPICLMHPLVPPIVCILARGQEVTEREGCHPADSPSLVVRKPTSLT